ncbi:hypothetical protein [Streptosporangium roseum]|uniref:hypothetical protein n=1 Tax=Streptosporangium roseum TaxID=2001 RepID=UPI0001A3E70C
MEQSQKPLSLVITAGQRGDSPQFKALEPVIEEAARPRAGSRATTASSSSCHRSGLEALRAVLLSGVEPFGGTWSLVESLILVLGTAGRGVLVLARASTARCSDLRGWVRGWQVVGRGRGSRNGCGAGR